MKEETINKIDEITRNLNKDHKNFLYTDTLRRLIKLMSEDQSESLKVEFDTLLKYMQTVSQEYNRANRKEYITQYRKIKTIVRDKFGYKEKGSIYGYYFLTIFTFGIITGPIFGNMGLTLSLGLLFGTAIGLSREKSAEKKGLIY